MAVNDVLNQLQQLIQRTAPRLIEGLERPRELLPFVPGERYTAQVQEQIANGRFLVLIRDQKLDLNLPRNTQPGQNVELRFVSADPRPTFVLDEEAFAGQSKTPVNFSDGARYLNGLLDRVKELATQARQQVSPEQAQQAAKPLLNGAPPATPQFAAALKEAVTKSGLFYESHQAQWVAGERPLADLLKEPQGRLSDPRAAQWTQLPQAPNAAPDVPALQHRLADLGRPPQVENPLRPGMPGAHTPMSEPVHPQTAPLVQQQLETLDTRQMVWMGQVWPGQNMEWQIEEREARQGEGDAQQEWATTLNLTLPMLGEVHAVLRLTPGGIAVDLRTGTDQSAQKLRAALPLLGDGMQRAELKLAKVTVAQSE